MAPSISLATLLEQSQPQIEAHQALIIFSLQNDFLASDGKLPVPLESGWLQNIKRLVPRFRDFVGDVIWVRHEFQSERLVSAEDEKVIVETSTSDLLFTNEDLVEPEDGSKSPARKPRKGQKRMKAKQFFRDIGKKEQSQMAQLAVQLEEDELFLTPSSKGPCCLPGSSGAAMAPEVASLVRDDDLVIVTPHYSALSGTSLLMMLRMRLITELFMVGCMTNLSVYATAQVAASHGFAINLVEDCLGYRIRRRHDAAIENMVTVMGAYKTTSAQMLEEFARAERDEEDADSGEEGESAAGIDGLTTAVGQLDVHDNSRASMDGLIATLGLSSMDGRNVAPVQLEEMDVTTLAESLATASLGASSDLPSEEPVTAGSDLMALSLQSSQAPIPSTSSPDLSHAANIRVRTRRRNGTEPTPAIPELPHAPIQTARTEERSSGGGKNSDIMAQILKTTKRVEDSQKRQEAVSASAPANRDPASSAGAGGLRGNLALASAGTNANMRTPMTQNYLESSSELFKHALSKPTPMKPAPHSAGPSADPDTMNPKASSSPTARKFRDLSNMPALGPGDDIGEGDTFITYDLIPSSACDGLNSKLPLRDTIFDALHKEVQWQKMFHAAGEVPRLVAVQGAVAADGSKPVYRHPSDQSPPLLPFTRQVDVVRQAAEKVVGHPLNHVLIQLYRGGTDYISEHSDKTLDIMKGSKIVNASFGAQRTMRLRTKRNDARNHTSPSPGGSGERGKQWERERRVGTQRVTQRVHMPHNSLFVLGLATNRNWLHGITQDKRADRDRGPEELAYGGRRISLTFRQIGTFLDKDETLIWGQGARGKSREDAGDCVNADETAAKAMIDAFGFENKEGDAFDWEEVYGEGFDVLNMRALDDRGADMQLREA